MRASRDGSTLTISADKLHKRYVDEAVKDARARANLLDRMAAEHNDDFMRESCMRKAETLRILCDEVERLQKLTGGNSND